MIPFVKMHGLGNDFVVIDERVGGFRLSQDERRRIADRRLGVGCDQLLILDEPSNGAADLFMRIYNPDGGEAGACGNGTRCVAALLLDELATDAAAIETTAGVLPVARADDGWFSADLGAPRLDWAEIPLAREMDTLRLDLEIDGYAGPSAVNMGNPHCVFFVEDADAVPLESVGPKVEHDPLFPDRTNVEFVSVRPDGGLRMRVWERAAGITQACGSGACAALVAAHRRGLAGRKADIHLDGGVLSIKWRESDDHVVMTGPVATAFHGAWRA
ncbi:MAG: diaminopimelate epimerase [Alphaproteobacteria bacterium]|nr:diaminopimelate epimerase [Alphaproteobacteria bacterium]